MVHKRLQQGKLVRLFEDWPPSKEIIHAIFPTKRGLPPAVRLFIDFLAYQYSQMEIMEASV
ncbi:LysR substrate-binding domain-containing protein [Pleionea sp. CnH1-48]|uniref:LysR substrate-binding domain-containing protein n=1 Tax=Pleionea sp. CnH1-48 TaxID=2954494 RepID=UPI0035305B51